MISRGISPPESSEDGDAHAAVAPFEPNPMHLDIPFNPSDYSGLAGEIYPRPLRRPAVFILKLFSSARRLQGIQWQVEDIWCPTPEMELFALSSLWILCLAPLEI